MLDQIPTNQAVIAVALFVAGVVFAALGSFIGRSMKSGKRDPKDARIRALESELRIAKADLEKAQEQLKLQDKELEAAREKAGKDRQTIEQHVASIASLRSDLRDSVRKTRELRSELSKRATENVKSEVKLREVETELEVTRASSDMIATGILDYSVAADNDDDSSPDSAEGR